MKRLSLIALAFLLASCAGPQGAGSQAIFFQNLSALCGRTFEGRVTSPPVEADADFAGRRLVMYVRDCGEDELRIPFHVGEDRSRTWIVRRERGPSGTGLLSLKHDHRHADGSEDRLSLYGGATVTEGSASRQEFPADAFSRALFEREGIPQSSANVWALELHPARMFAYELSRPGRFFRVQFDLERPVEVPGR